VTTFSLREKLVKIGAKVVRHGRYANFQMAEVAVSRQMFADMLMLIAPVAGTAGAGLTGFREVERCGRRQWRRAFDQGKQPSSSATRRTTYCFSRRRIRQWLKFLASPVRSSRNWGLQLAKSGLISD
jgi:hypothetical protein